MTARTSRPFLVQGSPQSRRLPSHRHFKAGEAQSSDLLEVSLLEAPASEDTVQGLLEVAQVHYNATRTVEAIRTSQTARVRASGLGNRNLKRRASSILGAMLTDGARYQEAAEALTDALSLARQGGRIEEEIPVLSNLSVLLRKLGQFPSALKAARKALELCEGHPQQAASEALAAANLLDVALAMREPSLVSDWLYRALPRWSNAAPGACLGRTLFFANRARLFVILNDPDRARADVERLREEDLSIGRVAYVAGLAEGVVDCALGCADAGLARLDGLRERTQPGGTLYQEVLAACAEGAEVCGKADRALRYLRDLAELQRARVAVVGGLPADFSGDFVADQWRESSVLANSIFRLEGIADRQVTNLLSAAIDCAVAAGYDLQRCFRVGKLVRLFATELRYPERRINELEIAGRVYDVGMMAMPGRILSKTGSLSAGEAAIVQEHARYGAEIIRGLQLELLDAAAAAAHAHHERWDGEGYPKRLAGEVIPIEGRIVAICDCFDAMTHLRPYRPRSMSIPAALRATEDEAGRKLDPFLVPVFVKAIQKEFWLHDDFEQFLALDAYDNQYVRSRQRLQRLV